MKTVSSFAHGCVFFSWGSSRRCDGLRCWTFWRLVPQRKGAWTLPCKVVKVVSLEVFFFSRHQLKLRVSPACRPTAIMARRTGERSAALTPSTRASFRDKHLQFHTGLLAFSWSFVLITSALSCGYCEAETEFSILEEAQVLADQMKKLSSQELGVFTMQVKEEEKCFYWCLYVCFCEIFATSSCGGFKDPELAQTGTRK